MKKILPLLLLLFLLILPGCTPDPWHTCTVSGLIPYEEYIIVYDLGNNKFADFMRRANGNGTATVTTKINIICDNVMTVRRTSFNLSLSASTSSIYLPSPPSTVTITGGGFDTTYGAPRVDYFDGNGYLVGSVYATSVSGDGTSLTANVPDLSSVYSGSYQIQITNKTYQGYYSHTVGTANVSAYGRERLDSDSDGYYDDEDCDPYDPYRNTWCGGCPEDPTAIICP